MDRRGALKHGSIASLGLIISGPIASALLKGCSPKEELNWSPLFFSSSQAFTAGALAEQILPKTKTPGALDLGVDIFIDKMVLECLAENEKTLFKAGVDELEERSRSKFNSSFHRLSSNEQAKLVKEIQSLDELSFFYRFKELTLLGYFSTEQIMKQYLSHIAIPTRLEGCKPLEPGQKLMVGNHIERMGFEERADFTGRTDF
ncbi:MAG: gluconate 2-dehydrogenase subunit 3 family protein [Bacteroidota bacterium]